MIYTVTFNPSLDYIVEVPSFQMGMTNRTTSESIFPGGKGINVSMVLQNLGVESTALGFTAGFVGDEICRLLQEKGCHTAFMTLPEGCSRINVKLKSADGTEINARGPSAMMNISVRWYGMTSTSLSGIFEKPTKRTVKVHPRPPLPMN